MPLLIPFLFAGGGVWAGIKISGGFDRIGLVLILLLAGYFLYKKGFKL